MTTQKYWIVKDNGTQKTSEILKEMRELFDVYFYDEDNADKNFPVPKEPIIHKFRANVEADEEFKNKSANDLEKIGHKGITLRERLLLELQYYKMTGGHLDIANLTLCSGSRRSDGNVPFVRWNRDFSRLYVSGYRPDGRRDNLRSREQISLDGKPCSSSLEPFSVGDEVTVEIRGRKVKAKIIEI